jgi:hypothetical protein
LSKGSFFLCTCSGTTWASFNLVGKTLVLIVLLTSVIIDSEFLSYNLMLNSGKKIALRATKKNILTLVLSEKKILNATKNHKPGSFFLCTCSGTTWASFNLVGKTLVLIVLLTSVIICLLRDRPFNLKGGGYGFLFCSEFFFRTQELEYLFFLSREAQFFFQILTLGYITKTLNQIFFSGQWFSPRTPVSSTTKQLNYCWKWR